MPLLRKAQLQPVQGIDLSLPGSYLPEGNAFPQNLKYWRGEWKKRDGRTQIGGASLGALPILHLAMFELSNGTNYLIRHTKQNVERYNATSGLWEDITGLDLTGGNTNFFSSCVVNEYDYYLFVNDLIDNVRKYIGSGVTGDLGGSPGKAKCIEYVTPYVLLANLEELGSAYPYKLKWCDTGEPEIWTGGNSGSVLLSDEPSAIRTLKKFKNYIFAYKEKSVYRGAKVSTSSIFDFPGPFSMGKGIYSPRAIADNGAAHFYMGIQDFHQNDGLRITDIGKPVREYIFSRLSRDAASTCHAIHVEELKEIWFFIVTAAATYPTEVWKYNYDLGFWYFDDIINCLCAALYKQTSTRTWNAMTGTWEQFAGIWDAQSGTTTAPFPVFGYDIGTTEKVNDTVYNDNGKAITARLDTKDFCGLLNKGIERDSRWLQFDLWAKGNAAKLWYSTDEGNNWTYIGQKTMTLETVQRYSFYFDIIAPRIRFRIQCDGLDQTLTIRGFMPFFLDAGEILK